MCQSLSGISSEQNIKLLDLVVLRQVAVYIEMTFLDGHK